jgi:hypothetical protein
MALTKTQKAEITGISEPYRILKIRVTTEILEDGEQISKSKTEDTLYPHQDISDQEQNIQDIANLIWTKEIKDSYLATFA